MITSSNDPRSDEQYTELTSLALRGLRLLSSWTAQVMELVRGLTLWLLKGGWNTCNFNLFEMREPLNFKSVKINLQCRGPGSSKGKLIARVHPAALFESRAPCILISIILLFQLYHKM